eukprot:g36139.t1
MVKKLRFRKKGRPVQKKAGPAAKKWLGFRKSDHEIPVPKRDLLMTNSLGTCKDLDSPTSIALQLNVDCELVSRGSDT